jgi:hypothetical protein
MSSGNGECGRQAPVKRIKPHSNSPGSQQHFSRRRNGRSGEYEFRLLSTLVKSNTGIANMSIMPIISRRQWKRSSCALEGRCPTMRSLFRYHIKTNMQISSRAIKRILRYYDDYFSRYPTERKEDQSADLRDRVSNGPM